MTPTTDEAPDTRNPWKTTTYVLSALLVLSVGADLVLSWRVSEMAGRVGGTQVAGRLAGAPPSFVPAVPSDPVDVSADDDPAVGTSDAPIQVIAFLDYECPFCRRFHTDSFQRLVKDYVETGKVRYVTRDFPLANHAHSMPAAVAANCVRKLTDDATYYRYQDELFTGAGLDKGALSDQATKLGIDAKAFDDCTADVDGAIEAEIKKDMQDAIDVGVHGTPTFFVNGRILVGAQPFEAFKAAIEAQMKD